MLKCLKIRGLMTGWEEVGSRDSSQVFFFIHGYPDHAQMWRAQYESFSGSALCIAPYLRGVGPSETGQSKNRFSIPSLVLDLMTILQEVDPQRKKKVAVICHDIGGLYGFELARMIRSQLSHLVLINSLSVFQMGRRLFASQSQLRKSWYIGVFQIPKLAEILISQKPKLVEDSLSKRPKPFPSLQDLKLGLNWYRQAPQFFWSHLLRVRIKLNVPTLVIWGKDDPYLNSPSVHEFRKECPQTTIRVLEGGHWIHENQPERINGILSDFFGVKLCQTSSNA